MCVKHHPHKQKSRFLSLNILQIAVTSKSIYAYRFSVALNFITTEPRKSYIPIFFCKNKIVQKIKHSHT